MDQPRKPRRNRPPTEKSTPVPVIPARNRRPSVRQARKMAGEENMSEEYAYVVRDLQRILVLAVAMFALLIVLNIVFQG